MTTAYPDDSRPVPTTPDDPDTFEDDLDDEDLDDDLDELDDELDDDAGQATTEYALVLLGAALVALLLIGWATSGGGAGKVGHLLDAVLDAITSKL